LNPPDFNAKSVKINARIKFHVLCLAPPTPDDDIKAQKAIAGSRAEQREKRLGADGTLCVLLPFEYISQQIKSDLIFKSNLFTSRCINLQITKQYQT
jgi:hypothetical protein